MRVGLDDMLEENTKVGKTQRGLLEPSSSQSMGLLSVASL